MKNLRRLIALICATLMLSVSAMAALPPAVISDDSYTPIHARPVFAVLDENGNENNPSPDQRIAVIADDSYAPVHFYPVAPLFDDAGQPLFEEAPLTRGNSAICPWCSKDSLKGVSKYLYETAGCGHNVYFAGLVCTDVDGCGYTKVNKWIYSCSCYN